MRPHRRGLLAAACACCAAAAVWPPRARAASREGSREGEPEALELGTASMTRIADTVWVARLEPGLWLHTCTALIDPGLYYPANGLVLERPGGALLIDTCAEHRQAEALLDWSGTALGAPIVAAVATHFHSDRTGGIAGLARRGVPTFAHPLTCELARRHGQHEPRPIEDFLGRTHAMGAGCELFFPGAGHSRDNIVAWLPRQGTLFGGCFLKSVTSRELGNLQDADPEAWGESLRRVRDRYPGARRTVPGHGVVAGDPVAWTLGLLERRPA
jgi:metallo-beta-lactamase class B